MNINIHIDINMNIGIHIIINMNIETYIIYYLLSILYWLFPIIYFLADSLYQWALRHPSQSLCGRRHPDALHSSCLQEAQ